MSPELQIAGWRFPAEALVHTQFLLEVRPSIWLFANASPLSTEEHRRGPLASFVFGPPKDGYQHARNWLSSHRSNLLRDSFSVIAEEVPPPLDHPLCPHGLST
jgi:hypothetical protein